MSPKLYVDNISPCSRAVVLAIRRAGLETVIQVEETRLATGDHLSPKFVQKFPLHCVPAFEDNGFYLWDSHAIVTYLISAYAEDDTLYPKNLKKRAKVDQWLHFSNTTLYNRIRDISEPLWFKKSKVISEEKCQRAEEAYKMVEDQIGDHTWLCGEELTLADICCVCQISTLEVPRTMYVDGSYRLFSHLFYKVVPAKGDNPSVFIGDTKHYPKLTSWYERCKSSLDGYHEITDEQVKIYAGLIKSMTS